MHPKRKRRFFLLILILIIIAAAVGLMVYALRQNINLFYTPSQIALGQAPLNHPIRIGGMVVKGSITRLEQDKLNVHFKITDYKKTIIVHFYGILPDLFRDGQGIVANGQLKSKDYFNASEVLAKHDENYMPPEVKSTLITTDNKSL
ncbi:MAG: cytochrome c maturation protein CcmE [Legionella sp.]